jgi:hypothetical protein
MTVQIAQIWVKLFNFYSVIRNYYYFFFEQLSLLVSQQRLYFVLLPVLIGSAVWTIIVGFIFV